MSDSQRDELKRLQVASLRQGGMACRQNMQILKELQQIRKDSAQHFQDDAKFQLGQVERVGEIEIRQQKASTEMWWLKKAVIALFGLVGIHWIR
jgi:hypothetical protein